MSNLLNSYPIFENNQVLTSSQLNELVAYLDEQNRLTRAKLIGTGIACGFDLALNQSVTPPEITIFKGMGITSEGFLITEGDCVVRRYRDYNLPAGARYVPFEDPVTTVQDVTLYELLTDDAPTLPTDNIRFLNNPVNFVNDKVVLLFIEIIDVDQQSCLGKSCDESGKERMFNLRKLVISKTDLNKVLARTCTQTGLYPQQYNLPEIFMRRALFNNAPNANTSDYFAFSKTYVNAIRSTALPGTGTIYDQIFNALRQVYVDFSPILSDQYGGVNPFTGFPTAAWTNYLNGASSPGPSYLGMQYFYDFLKDLILAYNEFRDVAFELMSECCNDMDCFPQHLMLGEVVPTGSCQPSPYRHYFVTSPIFGNQEEKAARAVSLFQRMVLMVNKFDQNTIQNAPVTPVPPNTLAVPLYVTPSNEKRDPLSKRSIPYYYRIHETQANLGTLEQSWNYDFKLKCLFSKGLAPLAYGNQNADQASSHGPVQTPLFYDLDPYNFLRIEGGIRQNVFDVQAQLEKIKNDFDLPFNIVALRLAGDPVDDIVNRCEFNDLRTEYGTLRTELTSVMQDLFNRYGAYDREGNITIRSAPQFITSLLNDCNTGVLNGSVTQPQIGVTSILNALNADSTGSTAVNNTAEAIPISNTGLYERAAAPVVNATASPARYPVYAPQRTMNAVLQKLQSDTQNLLVALNTLINFDLPFQMTDFRFGYTGTVQDSTPGFIQDYFTALQAAINIKVSYNQLLDLIIRNTKTRNTPELYADLMAYYDEIMGQLERFITDPGYKSLMLLSYNLQYRLTQLKANDMTLFSNFITKHPGIEHQAGVPKGGTYILVYPGNNVIDPIKRNFVVNQTRELTAIKLQNAQIMAQPVISVQDRAIMQQNDAKLANYQLVSQQLAVQTIPLQRIAIDAYQVVADFTLPYLCCCDCECDAIPAPKTVTDLNMPALAVPFYAQYSLGDYAFGKDVHVGTATTDPLQIDIVPMLQYDKTLYQPSQVRLYLVDPTGLRLVFSQSAQSTERLVASMETGNYPNVPVTKATSGSVTVVVSSSSSKAQKFQYTPDQPGPVIDSFYYMFEIVSTDNSAVLQRSSMGKVTVTICSR